MSTAQASLPLAAGTRLDVYDIAGVLEQGRYSITYLARDAAGGEVMIKEFLPQEFALREDGVVRAREVEDRTPLRFWLRSFLDKAVLLQKLNHPGLIRVLRQFEANGTGYYVTERVAGETLEAILEREGVLSEAQLRRLLASVLAGLEQVHALGLLHRDIRPQNLLVRPDDSAVLSDFGVLRAPIRFKARTVFSAGTPPYAAPEEFFMAGPHGPWTDLYALGATAHRVVTGKAPSDARSRATGPALVPVAMSARVRCSDTLAAAIDEALRLPAEQRPQSVAAWRIVLQGSAAEPAERSFDASPLADEEDGPPARSKLPLLLGAVAVAAVAGAYFLLRPHGPGDGQSAPAAVNAEPSAGVGRTAVAAPAAGAAAAPARPAAAAGADAGLDRLALDLMAKEKKAQDAREQQQTLQMQREQDSRAAAPVTGRTTAAASAAAPAAAPPQAELDAAARAKQLEAEVARLRADKDAQEQAAAEARKAQEQAAAQAAANARADQERQAKIIAVAKAKCRIPASELSASGNLTYERALLVAGAEKRGNGAVRLPPVSLSDGGTAVFEITPDSCARMVSQ